MVEKVLTAGILHVCLGPNTVMELSIVQLKMMKKIVVPKHALTGGMLGTGIEKLI